MLVEKKGEYVAIQTYEEEEEEFSRVGLSSVAHVAAQKGKLFGNIAKPSVSLVRFRVRHKWIHTYTHTLQNTDGLSFPVSEGQTEEGLKMRLAPKAEGWRGKKDERAIHPKVQEMTRTGGSRKTDGLNQASDGKS